MEQDTISAGAEAGAAANRLAAIVESSVDAIFSQDLDGSITSWNQASERLFGYAADEAIGRPSSILLPPDRKEEEDIILERIRHGRRVEAYETKRRRNDGGLVEIFLTVSPIKDHAGGIVGASTIARDISGHRRNEERLLQQTRRFETLNYIARIVSSDLDLERVVQTVTDFATDLSGARFGAFFYNVVGADGEAYRLYTLSGAPREAFEKLGLPRITAIFEPTFRGTGIIRSDDIRADPRYGKSAPHHGMPAGHLPVASYLAVPVVSRSGEVLGGLLFGHDQPGVFTRDSEQLVAGIAAHAAVAIDNARLHQAAQAEIEQRRLLLAEMQHRVRNTLSLVQAVAGQTFRDATPEHRAAFGARLGALADAQELLTGQHWGAVAIADVVRRALRPFEDGRSGHIRVAGPPATLGSSAALSLAMALHELATNAVKHGALSTGAGSIDIAWEPVADAEPRRLKLAWRETGGPPVKPPTREGFGLKLISLALGSSAAVELNFAPQGLDCSMEFPL